MDTQLTTTSYQSFALPTFDSKNKIEEEKGLLLQAVLNRNLEEVRHLLTNKKVDPNVKTKSGRTPLAIACEAGDIEIVQELTKKKLEQRKAHLHVQDDSKIAPIHLVVRGNKSDELKLQLLETLLKDLSPRERETLLDLQDDDNQTVLHKAVVDSGREVVQKLIDWGADIHAETKKHFVPLHFAARYNTLDVVKVLVENGAHMHVKSNVENPENSHIVEYKVSPKKRALQSDRLEVACYLAMKSGKRSERALVKGNHLKLAELLNADVARTRNFRVLAKERFEKLFREASTNSDDIRLKVCCLKKLGDLMRLDGRFLDAIKLYSLALLWYGTLSPARQYRRERQPLLDRLAAVEKGCIGKQKKLSLSVRKRRSTREVIIPPILIDFSSIHCDVKRCFDDEANIFKFHQQILQESQVTDTSIQGFVTSLNKAAKDFTNVLVQECVETLGPPPCDYAIISLGAMSWAEMLLSSDFAFGILLSTNAEENKKYFQTLAYQLTLKLMAKAKTEYLPLQQANCGNPASKLFLCHTFSPLEVPILVSAHQEMANNQKEPTPLANFLKTVHFVHGSKEKLVINYRVAMEAQINKQVSTAIFDAESIQRTSEVVQKAKIAQERKRQLLSAMESDLMDFSLGLSKAKEEKGSLYIKRECHRFLGNVIQKLCLYYDIVGEDTWERLNKLKTENKIGGVGYKNLCEAMNAILSLRLKRHEYSFRKSDQDKQTIHIEFNEEDRRKLVEILRVLLPLQKTLKAFCRIECPLDDETFYDVGVIFEGGGLNARACVSEGEAAERLFAYSEAKEWYKRAVHYFPTDIEAQNALGRILYKMEDYDEAIAQYEKMLTLSSLNEIEKHEINCTLGVAYYAKVKEMQHDGINRTSIEKELNRGIIYCNKVEELKRVWPMSLAICAMNERNKGNLKRIDSKLNEALEYYKKALASCKELSSIYGIIMPLEVVRISLDLAAVQAYLNEPTLALNFYEEAGELCMSPAYRYAHGEMHLEMQGVLDGIKSTTASAISKMVNIFEISRLCDHAIRIFKNLVEQDHFEVAVLLETLGEACYACYELKSSEYLTAIEKKSLITFLKKIESFYKRAKEIYMCTHGDDHFYMREVQSKEAAINGILTQKDEKMAGVHVQSVLKVQELDPLERAKALEQEGDHYLLNVKALEEARESYMKALAVYAEIAEGHEDMKVPILKKLVDLCADLKEHASIIECCDQLIAIYEGKLASLRKIASTAKSSPNKKEEMSSCSFMEEQEAFSEVKRYKMLKRFAECTQSSQ